MGRPTDEKKEKTVKLRISGELYEEIERRGDNISETIRSLIRDGMNYVPQKKVESEQNSVPQNTSQGIMSEETYRDLEQMCRASHMTVSDFMEHIRELFNDGRIYVEGFEVKTKGEYDLGYLLDVCHRANVDPQEMINKLANSLVRR